MGIQLVRFSTNASLEKSSSIILVQIHSTGAITYCKKLH